MFGASCARVPESCRPGAPALVVAQGRPPPAAQSESGQIRPDQCPEFPYDFSVCLRRLGSLAGGLEGCKPSQILYFPAGGGRAAATSGKDEILGRRSRPKPHHRASRVILYAIFSPIRFA